MAKEINNNIYKREVRDIQIEAELINEFSYEGEEYCWVIMSINSFWRKA